jgi:hypothetical protein
METDMRRHATAAAALAMVMTATAASATVISGTWSLEVDAWEIPDWPNIPTTYGFSDVQFRQ